MAGQVATMRLDLNTATGITIFLILWLVVICVTVGVPFWYMARRERRKRQAQIDSRDAPP